MVLECSGVNQHSSTFWSVTLQPVGADQATMWQMEGDIPSIHIRHRRLFSIHRLQRYGGCINLNNFPLVCHTSKAGPIAAGDHLLAVLRILASPRAVLAIHNALPTQAHPHPLLFTHSTS